MKNYGKEKTNGILDLRILSLAIVLRRANKGRDFLSRFQKYKSALKMVMSGSNAYKETRCLTERDLVRPDRLPRQLSSRIAFKYSSLAGLVFWTQDNKFISSSNIIVLEVCVPPFSNVNPNRALRLFLFFIFVTARFIFMALPGPF